MTFFSCFKLTSKSESENSGRNIIVQAVDVQKSAVECGEDHCGEDKRRFRSDPVDQVRSNDCCWRVDCVDYCLSKDVVDFHIFSLCSKTELENLADAKADDIV